MLTSDFFEAFKAVTADVHQNSVRISYDIQYSHAYSNIQPRLI